MGNSYTPQAKSIEWETPQHLFDEWDKEFDFTLDPCATHDNVKCAKYYTKEENGLDQSWRGESVFLNPPYVESLSVWVRKASYAARFCKVIVALLPVRTGTKWFHNYILHKAEIRFSGKEAAPFDSMLVIWRKEAV